mgnify:FL=1
MPEGRAWIQQEPEQCAPALVYLELVLVILLVLGLILLLVLGLALILTVLGVAAAVVLVLVHKNSPLFACYAPSITMEKRSLYSPEIKKDINRKKNTRTLDCVI